MVVGDFVKFDKRMQDKLAGGFHCSNDVLDRFIREESSLDDKYGKTYVLISEDGKEIIAYFNISPSVVIDVEEDISSGGAIYINYFALDNSYHDTLGDDAGNKVSDLILEKCLNIIKDIRNNSIGFLYITLHSTDMGYNMYKRRGFLDAESDIRIPSEKANSLNPMILVLDDINE